MIPFLNPLSVVRILYKLKRVQYSQKEKRYSNVKNNSALLTESSGVVGLQAPHVRAVHIHLGPWSLKRDVSALVTKPSSHCFRLHFRRVVLEEGVPRSRVFHFSKPKNAEARFVSREHSKQSTLLGMLGVTCV